MSHDRQGGARPQRRTRTYETELMFVQEQGRVFAPLADGKMAVPGSIRFRPYLAKRYRARVTEIEGRNQCPAEPIDTDGLDSREWLRDGVIIDTLVWKNDRRGDGLIAFHPWTGKICVPAKGQQIQPGPLQCSQMEKETVIICYRAEPLEGTEAVTANPDPNVAQPDNPFRDRNRPQGRKPRDGSGKKAEGDKPKPKKSGRRDGRRRDKKRGEKRPDVKARGPNRPPKAEAPKAPKAEKPEVKPAAECPSQSTGQGKTESPAPQPVVTYRKSRQASGTTTEPQSAVDKFRDRYPDGAKPTDTSKKSATASAPAQRQKFEDYHTIQAQILKMKRLEQES